MKNDFLEGAIKLLRYYKSLGDKAMEHLPDAQLGWVFNDQSNSIAVIIRHMSGNMLSRFTNFLTEDGEKPWRDRDAEFYNVATSRADLIKEWEKGWACVFDALTALREEDMGKVIYIRNEGHTVTDAVSRQLAHYAYHVGQIVYVAKMLDTAWQSLSIPPAGSAQYNADRFAREKMRSHFTDEVLKRDPENEQ